MRLTRRSFLGALAGLPVIASLVSEPEPDDLDLPDIEWCSGWAEHEFPDAVLRVPIGEVRNFRIYGNDGGKWPDALYHYEGVIEGPTLLDGAAP